MTDDNELSATA